MIKEVIPLDQVLQRRANKSPHATFVKFDGIKFSYQEINRLATVFAVELVKRGMKPGDRVALFCHNCPHYIAAYFGILRGGGIVLPLNNLLASEEIDFILNDASAALCLYDANCANTALKLTRSSDRSFVTLSELAHAKRDKKPFVSPPHTADDISTILYTSGTTGSPKGALMTHRNLLSNAQAATEVIHITHEDRFVVFLPLFHAFTYTVCVILPLITGARISLLPSVHPFSRVLRCLIVDRITIFVAIPTVYKILADRNMPFFLKPFLNLRLCVSGAAPLPVRVIHEFESAFKVPLLEGYGLTEAAPVVSFNPLDKAKRKPGTVGLPLPGITVKVIDDSGKQCLPGVAGELLVKGPNVMQGYLNKPEDTAKALSDGWLHTGDIASIDDSGHIRIIDRKKDMILVDGLNVYPHEVEEVLYRHTAIKDCSMIGVPHEHEEGKELAMMYIVFKDGVQVSPKQLREYLTKHVAHYKIPRRFIVTNELPRTATGKIMKKELRKLYRQTEIKHPPA